MTWYIFWTIFDYCWNIPKIVKNGQKNIQGVFYEFQDYFKNIPRFFKKYLVFFLEYSRIILFFFYTHTLVCQDT